MTESKEWVTIKIPKSVRDDAQDDPRTYGQIMQVGLEKADRRGRAERDSDMFELKRQFEHMAECPEDFVEGDVEFEPMVDTKAIMNRLDDLQAQLPKDVAEELSR